MTRIPASALLLTVAGLAPFLFGALLSLGLLDVSAANTEGGSVFLMPSNGALVQARYGLVILCFMSGVLWGFATKAQGRQATVCYVLSVIPALWAFLNPGARADEALINLMIGFAGVLMLDYAFSRWDLTPPWWMALRVPVTIVVLACLAAGVWA